MKTLTYTIQINAPIQKVWDTMLEDSTYREWTDVFSPGSYYEGKWETGSKMRFLGPDENGKMGGMVATILEVVPNKFVSIKHLGMVVDGVEDTTSEEVKAWAGGLENYTFEEKDGGTLLTVNIDVAEEGEWADMFNGMWPRALEKLKTLSETSN